MSSLRKAAPTFVCSFAALTVAAAGCGSQGGGPSEIAVEKDPPPCTQLHRQLARWQSADEELTQCGPDVSALIELSSLGGGRLLLRRRSSARYDLWSMAPDGTFGGAPITVAARDDDPVRSNVAGFVLVPSAAPGAALDDAPRMLMYDPRRSPFALFQIEDPSPAVSPSLAQTIFTALQQGSWTPSPPTGTPYWNTSDGAPWGHQFLGLEGGYLLDWSPGDGSQRLWRVEVGHPNVAEMSGPYPGAGPNPAFRRGHRLVYLGQGRLLEWMPVACPTDGSATALVMPGADPTQCARFTIWSNGGLAAATAADAPPAAFTQAIASGTWSGIGAHHDIALADAAHLVVWDHAGGRLASFALAPGALAAASGNPLASPTGASIADDRLKSIDWDPPTAVPGLKKLVVVVQDGRSFDSYFGLYCLAAPSADGAPAGCATGPACCDGMPAAAASGCRPLDPGVSDTAPNDSPACMRAKMNGGAMDRFGDAPAQPGDRGPCGRPEDVVCARGAAGNAIGIYQALAAQGALADRFFQTYAYADDGGSYADARTVNLLYLSGARFPFDLNFRDTPLLTKELVRQQIPWAIYAGPKTLPEAAINGVPVFYDPTWNPFRSLDELEGDAAAGQLPSVTVVAPDAGDPDHGESPGQPFASGIRWVQGLADRLAGEDTLILVTYATSGGYYDHVPPPAPWPADVDATTAGVATDLNRVPFGPRVPLLALGRFARANTVDHTRLEMSSIVAFIDWNWMRGRPLKVATDVNTVDLRRFRDGAVNNLGGLLDPQVTGVTVPDVVGPAAAPPTP